MMIEQQQGNLTLWQFTNLAAYPELLHAISDRHGGSSTAPYASLNLGASTSDDPAAVEANRRLLYSTLNIDPGAVVRVGLVHGTRVAVPDDGDIPAPPALTEADASSPRFRNGMQFSLLPIACLYCSTIQSNASSDRHTPGGAAQLPE